MVGDFETAELIDTLRRRFAKYPRGPDSFELPVSEIAEPPLHSLKTNRQVTHYGTDGVARLLAGFRTPGAAHPDTAALLVLAELLDSASHGLGATLYRKNQWVSSIGVSHGYLVDHGQFTIRAELDPANAGTVTHWLMSHLTRLSQTSFDTAAVEEAARRVLIHRARRWERFGEQAQELGLCSSAWGPRARCSDRADSRANTSLVSCCRCKVFSTEYVRRGITVAHRCGGGLLSHD